MNGSWDAYLVSPADFAGADDTITNLAKERKPDDSKLGPRLMFDYYQLIFCVTASDYEISPELRNVPFFSHCYLVMLSLTAGVIIL